MVYSEEGKLLTTNIKAIISINVVRVILNSRASLILRLH